MLTVLEAIKKYPDQFEITILARSRTTPSDQNRANHLALALAISYKAWDAVKSILDDPKYHRPLEGVIYCLNMHSIIDSAVHQVIIDMYSHGFITERK